MAKLTSDLDGGTIVELSDGSKLRVSALARTPHVDAQDLRNVVDALLEVVHNLDTRLAALEQRQAIDQLRRCEVARAI